MKPGTHSGWRACGLKIKQITVYSNIQVLMYHCAATNTCPRLISSHSCFVLLYNMSVAGQRPVPVLEAVCVGSYQTSMPRGGSY